MRAPADKEAGAARTVAAVDIGSNAVRLVVAQVHPSGHIEVLEQARRPVRLGHDVFTAGRLSERSMSAAITILRDYRRILDTYEVEAIRAVATSAVREALNTDTFLDRVARTAGLDVEVIEATEQSRLVVAAVRRAVGTALGLKRRSALIAEVGGGNTVLTILRKGEITASQSCNIGSIRIQDMLATDREPPARAAEMYRQQIAGTVAMAQKSLRLKTVGIFLAVGGDARFAAQQVGEPILAADLHAVRPEPLARLIEECASQTPEELAKAYGLPFADAETLVPALLVYQALLRATRADRLTVSQVSMRDGMLLDLLRYVTGEQDAALTEGVIRSAMTVGAKYRYDARHAAHVASLALRFFDELQKEHGLKPQHRLLLQVAALLHEVGQFVSSRAHHKHSYYLIANTEVFGLRREEILVAAHVARYHRRSMPKSTHLEYMALPREQRLVINKLAALLRLADALDRGHYQQVRDFQLERQGSDLVLYVKGAADLTLERRAAVEKGDLFQDVFGMKVRLEEEPSQVPPAQTAGAGREGM